MFYLQNNMWFMYHKSRSKRKYAFGASADSEVPDQTVRRIGAIAVR